MTERILNEQHRYSPAIHQIAKQRSKPASNKVEELFPNFHTSCQSVPWNLASKLGHYRPCANGVGQRRPQLKKLRLFHYDQQWKRVTDPNHVIVLDPVTKKPLVKFTNEHRHAMANLNMANRNMSARQPDLGMAPISGITSTPKLIKQWN